MSIKTLECLIGEQYARRAGAEVLLGESDIEATGTVLFVANGFEDRASRVLERLASRRASVSRVVIGRYSDELTLTRPDFDHFFDLASSVCAHGRPDVFDDDPAGTWVGLALGELEQAGFETARAVLDISGLSQGRVFGALDRISAHGLKPTLAYTEAGEYWPLLPDWERLQNEHIGEKLVDQVNELPWLFSHEHRVSFMPGHEGYDTGSDGPGLVAFLPFKSARLAAILNSEDYAEVTFVAGRPRETRNEWRERAQLAINRHLIRPESGCISLPTFGFRDLILSLGEILFGPEGLAIRRDVHITATGSKMQAIATWVLSSLHPSLSVIRSVPKEYHQGAYSRGSGQTWLITLPLPGVKG